MCVLVCVCVSLSHTVYVHASMFDHVYVSVSVIVWYCFLAVRLSVCVYVHVIRHFNERKRKTGVRETEAWGERDDRGEQYWATWEGKNAKYKDTQHTCTSILCQTTKSHQTHETIPRLCYSDWQRDQKTEMKGEWNIHRDRQKVVEKKERKKERFFYYSLFNLI